MRHLREAVLRRYQAALPVELRQAATWSTPQLQQALGCVSDRYSADNPSNPYDLLARLRLPIYVTTSTLDLMTRPWSGPASSPSCESVRGTTDTKGKGHLRR